MRHTVLLVVFAAVGCTIPPTPTPYRQRLIDAGVQKQVAGLVIHDEGSGPAVIMLHGLGGSAYDFRHQREPFLQAGFRVVVPDMLGAAWSPHPPDADYSMPAQAERIVRLMDELGLRRAHFIGNSYGGGISLAMATVHPERVDRLVLLDAAVIPQDFPWFVSVARSGFVGRILFWITPKRLMLRLLINFLSGKVGNVSEAEIAEYAHEHSFEGAIDGLFGMARDLRFEDAEKFLPKLSDVRAPTLILWGERDAVIPLRSGKILARLIPGARLEVIPGLGHIPHMERPERVTRRMLEFVKGDGEPVNGRTGER
ncbi:MAG: alpha/beta hydrolase [Planctomycetes bacterium]|nr:alpha/beta hydrolase [Planctomycetota bacterium]